MFHSEHHTKLKKLRVTITRISLYSILALFVVCQYRQEKTIQITNWNLPNGARIFSALKIDYNLFYNTLIDFYHLI